MKQLSLVAFVIFVIAMFAVAAPLATAAPHAEGKKGKTQHKTFSSTSALLIPDDSPANPYPSTIKVSGFKKGKVTDVDLTLRGINHGYADDVDVMLVAPNGDAAIVMSDAGGNTNALSLTIKLDDEAGAHLPDDGPLLSGTFQPTNFELGEVFPGAPAAGAAVALSTLDGGNPNGAWKLFVIDDAGNDVGAFSGGWDLKIAAKVKSKHHGHKKH